MLTVSSTLCFMGTLLFLLGVLTGFGILSFRSPRIGLSAHLAAIESVYSDRALLMVAEDSTALMKYDLAGASARGDYARGSAGENLALFTRTRRSTLALLTGLPASAGERTGMHSELGAITLTQMLNEWAHHDLGHLRQIAELYRAHAFYPNSGPFMKYSSPRP